MTTVLLDRRLALAAAIVLVAAVSLVVDLEVLPEAVRISLGWILIPGIVAIGLFFPSWAYAPMLLFDIGFYFAVFASIQAGSLRLARRRPDAIKRAKIEDMG